MSTYWYLECTSHDPPLRSADEVEQHTYGLPAIRELVAQRAALTDESVDALSEWHGDYFARHAVRFLIQHPACGLRLVSEYGDIEELWRSEIPRGGQMSEHTPTTDDIRLAWARDRRDWIGREFIEPQFDRWLAAHDREVRAESAEGASKAGETANVLDFKPHWSSNDRDLEILAFGEFLLNAVRDYAAAIREGK